MIAVVLALLAQAQAGEPIAVLPPLVRDVVTVSPDHTRIAVATEKEGVWIIDLATKRRVALVPPVESPVEYLAWSTDGATLGVPHRNAEVSVVDAATGAVQVTIPATSMLAPEAAQRVDNDSAL